MSQAALMCANHPQRETSLRCNRCGKPICSSCAVQTPVGYRCKECVRGQQAVFDTAGRLTLLVAAVVAGVGTGLAVALLAGIGFWIWGFFLAPIAGGGIAEIVRWSVRRRRHRRLPMSAALGAGGATAVYAIIRAIPWVFYLSAGDLSLLSGAVPDVLLPLGYGAVLIGTLYARLRGIRL